MLSRRFLGRLVSLAAASGRQAHHKIITVGSIQQLSTLGGHQESAGPRISSPNERPEFPGSRSQFTTDLKFVDPNNYEPIPVFRVLDTGGNLVANDYSDAIDLELAKRFQKGLYRKLLLENFIHCFQ